MERKKSLYEEEEEMEDVKWLKHYSSMHQILLVGEGDFSFSLSLAMAFGSAINIIATSYDSYGKLLRKYSKAQSNVKKLKKMGAAIIHGVDATKMKFHVDLSSWKFDRIVFNFPHAGFKGKEDHPRLIKLHRQLVHGFFRCASRMLWPYGEVHVSHKTSSPFSHWNLEELAAVDSLLLIECVDFCIEDYPGYDNKRGDGSRSDESFPLGKCSTFKFIIAHLHKMKNPSIKTDLLPSSPSFIPIMANNHLGYGSNDISYPKIHFPVNFERIPRSINGLPFVDLGYGSNDISYPKIHFPVNFERIPRSINGLPFVETAPPPLFRINNFSLRMHELQQFSTFPGVSLGIKVPLTSSYNADVVSEAPRRASLGYDYLRRYEELHGRGVSVMECGGMFERQVEWDREANQRRLVLCHGK